MHLSMFTLNFIQSFPVLDKLWVARRSGTRLSPSRLLPPQVRKLWSISRCVGKRFTMLGHSFKSWARRGLKSLFLSIFGYCHFFSSILLKRASTNLYNSLATTKCSNIKEVKTPSKCDCNTSNEPQVCLQRHVGPSYASLSTVEAFTDAQSSQNLYWSLFQTCLFKVISK